MTKRRTGAPAAASNRKRVEPWVGPWLRAQREAANKRLPDDQRVELDTIAARLGRSKSSISRIETGKAAIDADELPTMLRAWGTTVAAYAAESRRASSAAA